MGGAAHGRRGRAPKTPTLLDVLWVRGRLKLQNHERSLERLERVYVEAEPRDRWNAIIVLVSNDPEQLCRAIAALGADNAELSHVPTDGIRQHGSLTNQKLPAAMQHQAGLLLFGLRRHKPHRWPRNRLTDCGRVVRIVFAALHIGFYIARRQQPHRV